MFKKLKTVMYANDIDQKMLCKVIGRSQTYMTYRMTGRAPFDLHDVYAICDFIRIPYDKISEYFPKGGQAS